MIKEYYPVSVIVDMYPIVYDSIIPSGTEIAKVIVSGGEAPYTFEVLSDIGNASNLYVMDGDKVVTTQEITLDNLESFKVRVTESSVPQVAMATPVDKPSLEGEIEDDKPAFDNGERISQTVSLEATPSIQAVADVQSLFDKPNMIYKITQRYIITGTVTIPKNTTLDFQGGDFVGGTLAGWVNIKECNYQIFYNTSFAQGTYVPFLKPEYFGAVGDGITDSSMAITRMINATIASANTINYLDVDFKDLSNTKFIFSGRYLINSDINIVSPIYGLTLNGMNLKVGQTIDTVLNLTSDVAKFTLINSDWELDFKASNGLYVHGSYAHQNVIREVSIQGFLETGIYFAPSLDGSINKILDSSIFQIFDSLSNLPSIVTTGIGLLLSNNSYYTTVQGVHFGVCKAAHINDTGDSTIYSDCHFWGANGVTSDTLPEVVIAPTSSISNCEFSNARLVLRGQNTVTNNSFYLTTGGGIGFIYCGGRSSQHTLTLIRNNVFKYIGTKVTEGAPVMQVANNGTVSALTFNITLIDNRYSNTLPQTPLLNSSIVLDAIINLVPTS